MKNLILFISIALIPFSELTSQDIYVVKTDNSIYRVWSNGNLQEIVTIKELGSQQVSDIAISPSNKLYGMTGQRGIIEIDWETGHFETISTNMHFNSSSLVSVNENELYYLNSSKLYSYNITLDSSIFIADLGFTTPGDLCMLNRNVIFPTLYDIKAYNLDTEELSTVYCFPEAEVHWGISSLYANCDSSTILLSYPNTFSSTDFISIDLHTGMTKTINGTNGSTVDIWGMASSTENTGFDCESFAFMDIDCEKTVSTGNNPNNHNEITIYPNPINEFFHIKGCSKSYTVDLYDSKGMLIKRYPEIHGKVDISQLNAGIYFASIQCEGYTNIHKIVKL